MSAPFVGVIDVSAEWMTDLKEGFCPQYGYYNKESCCWFSNQVCNMILIVGVDLHVQCTCMYAYDNIRSISLDNFIKEYYVCDTARVS